jgi:hypothetical protein
MLPLVFLLANYTDAGPVVLCRGVKLADIVKRVI